MYYHIIEDGGHYNVGTHGCTQDKDEAYAEANRLQDLFPNLIFYVYPSPNSREPEFITL
jgi:hypothetical protein